MKISLSQISPNLVEQDDPIEMLIGILNEITTEFRRFGDRNVDLRNNVKCDYIEVTSPGAANTEFTVTHGLGKVPFMHLCNVDLGAVIYDSRRADWTSTSIFLKSTVASVAVRCLVFG